MDNKELDNVTDEEVIDGILLSLYEKFDYELVEKGIKKIRKELNIM